MFRHLLTEVRRLRVLLLAVMVATGLLFIGSGPAFAINRGSSAAISSYPYMARISYQTYDGTHGCDGMLIGPRWVATAAHCVINAKTGAKLSPGAFKVAVGVDQPNWGSHWLAVNRVEYHPNFPAHLGDAQPWPADIGLIQISQSVSNTTLPLANSEPAVGSIVTFAGWGCTNNNPKVECGAPTRNLMTATSTVKSDQECVFAKSGQAFVAFDICTSRSGPSSTVRHGDSGGPMIKQTPLGARLAGIISGSDAAKDYSTSVAYVLPWIHQVTGIGAPAESSPAPAPSVANLPLPMTGGSGTSVYYYQVYHTCVNGACGLRFHPSASYTDPTVTRTLYDDTTVGIVCQTRGQSVSGKDGSSSSVWDKTDRGDFAADFYISTPGMTGSFSPPIPQC